MKYLYIYLIGVLINYLTVRREWRRLGYRDEFGIEYVYIVGSWITLIICLYRYIRENGE